MQRTKAILTHKIFRYFDAYWQYLHLYNWQILVSDKKYINIYLSIFVYVYICLFVYLLNAYTQKYKNKKVNK